MSTPLEDKGARHKDSYFPASDENASELKDTDAEFKRLKADFLRIAHNRRQRSFSKSESSRSLSPIRRQPQRRSTNLPKFKIATFYSTDVELWFNQIKAQFDLHQITNDDERYRLTCAALAGEVASDVRNVLLQPFHTHKYENLKGILIERRRLTTPERVNKVISGEKLGSDIPSRFLRRLQKTVGFGTTAVVGNLSGFHSADAYLNMSSFSYTARQCVIGEFGRVSCPSSSFRKRRWGSKTGGCWNTSQWEWEASWTVGRPVSQVKKIIDSHSNISKEELQTSTHSRESCPKDTVLA